MKTIKGPGIFLAQFAGDAAPFNTLEGMAKWAAGLGFTGIQIPSWDLRLFDLQQAAESKSYCDEVLGVVALVAMHDFAIGKAFEKRRARRAVGDLSAGEHEGERAA